MQFLDELPELNRIAVPRWLGVQQTPQFRDLHGFADASERAYASVVYLRVGDNDGLARTQLIMAKTKVAPLTRISLPRLELCAAALLTKLMALTCASLDLSGTAVHLWSDSTITLAWIQGHPSRWKTYVANRVSEIQRTLPEAQWHHVSSQDNPADCASRGLPPNQLPDFALWWTGPVWLTTPGGWDSKNQPTLPLTDLEARTTSTLRSGEPATGNPLLFHYSNIISLLRTTAWCLRWLPRRDSLTLGCRLMPTEVEAARVRWLRLVQHQEFATDIQQLEGGRPLPSRNRLRRLNPYLDEQGLLRVGGRPPPCCATAGRTTPNSITTRQSSDRATCGRGPPANTTWRHSTYPGHLAAKVLDSPGSTANQGHSPSLRHLYPLAGYNRTTFNGGLSSCAGDTSPSLPACWSRLLQGH